jgi:P-type Cu2+ transporter
MSDGTVFDLGSYEKSSAQSESSVLCDHCQLAVPTGLIDEHSEHQFCCNGCKAVYEVLQGAGLDGYYSVRDAVSQTGQAQNEGRLFSFTESTYEEFDDPALHDLCVENLPGGYAQAELMLEGMHCAACVWLIERLGKIRPGVIESRANISRRTATVIYQPDVVKLSQVARSLDKLGYTPHPARGGEAREARSREDRKFLIRVGVAGALAGNVMLLAIALYGGALEGISESWETTFRYYSMGLALVSLLWPGRVFFTGAIAALRTRTAHLDIPIALALATGGIWGSFNTLTGHGEIYFDSLAILVFLLLVGRWVQHRQQRSAADHVELMLTLTPSSANRVNDDGSVSRTPIEAIEVGDLVEVDAGGSIPADGEIDSVNSQDLDQSLTESLDTTSIDNAFMTGESRPITVRVGDEVVAGATNLRSPIRIRVSAIGDSTRAAKLMKLVASATNQKAPIVLFADRVASRFVITVIMLALMTAVGWGYAVDLSTGIEYATALLIVTCPCALGLATPMAMSIAMGRAAKAGILIKSASALESMHKTRNQRASMVLDKTGTITEGAMEVVGEESKCDSELLAAAASIESFSNHPIARAIVRYASGLDNSSPSLPIAAEIVQTTGYGVSGRVDNKRVTIGSPSFIRDYSDYGEQTQSRIDSVLAQVHTPVVLVAQDLTTGENRYGVLSVGDPIRTDTSDSIEDLKGANWDITLCSGDHPHIAAQVARAVGIDDAMGAVSPEDKAELIGELQGRSSGEKNNRVVMVGDGVNDSAALARADVGIAVQGGAEASLQAADIYLTKPGVAPIVTLVALATHTMRTIHISLAFSICYNIIAATLAMSGLISALIAAILMPISSLTVVAISTRRFQAPKHKSIA